MAEKTSAGLVAWCEENLGMPYWYCSQGQKPTLAWLEQKIAQYPPAKYPKLWTPAHIAKAKGEAGKFARAFDCVGLIKGYLWVQPDGSIKYKGSQDKSADGMLAACKEKGPIAALPEAPGVLVFMKGHVGVYVGGGRVVECYGFKNVAKRPLSVQKWTHWGRCPYIEYRADPAPETPAASPQEPQGNAIRKGDRVRVRQTGVPYYPGAIVIPKRLAGQEFTVNGLDEKDGVPRARLAEILTWCAITNLEKVKCG